MKTLSLTLAFFGICLQASAANSIRSNVLELYVDAKDAQPRCLECRVVRLNVNKNMPMGVTVISDIQSRIVATYGPQSIANFVNFELVSDSKTKSVYKAKIQIPSYLVRETDKLDIIIEGYGRKCINSARLDCSFLVERDTLKATVSDVFSLTAK